VLAPTYISSGVGGKPTAQFSAVNVQIVNGSGVEATINGEGNLVVGYDEKPGNQTGSRNLVLGGANSYSSYGGLVGGTGNSISNSFASVLGGAQNVASQHERDPRWRGKYQLNHLPGDSGRANQQSVLKLA